MIIIFMLKPFLCHPSTATQNIMPPTVGSTLTPQDASITCSSGLIECFVFASIGAVGGSCSGDPFKEDSTNTWDYMPLSATWLKGLGVRFSWSFSTPGVFFKENLLQKCCGCSKVRFNGKWRLIYEDFFWEMVGWTNIQLMILFHRKWDTLRIFRKQRNQNKNTCRQKKTADMETLRKKDKFSKRLFLRYSPWIWPCLFTLFFSGRRGSTGWLVSDPPSFATTTGGIVVGRNPIFSSSEIHPFVVWIVWDLRLHSSGSYFADSITIRCNDEMSFLHDWHADQIHWESMDNNHCFLIGGNSNIFLCSPRNLGKSSNLTNMFQMGLKTTTN